jgi:hypothetical protein
MYTDPLMRALYIIQVSYDTIGRALDALSFFRPEFHKEIEQIKQLNTQAVKLLERIKNAV